jgi:predicted DCC family thiol-disulfide oxidoreductase YuxK
MPHTLILRRAANRDLVLPVKPTCNPRPALLFDGECGLCNRVVRVLLRLDRGGSLVFGPLQDPPAQGFLRSHGLPTRDFDSMVFVPDWNRREQPGFLLRTDGVLAALRFCGGAGRILGRRIPDRRPLAIPGLRRLEAAAPGAAGVGGAVSGVMGSEPANFAPSRENGLEALAVLCVT